MTDIVERLYNSTPNIHDNVEAGAEIQTLRAQLFQAKEERAISGREVIPSATWRDLIPWDAIHPRWQWIAWESKQNTELYPYLFTREPQQIGNLWDQRRGDIEFVGLLLSLPTPDCPWYETATERPKKK